MSECLFDNYIHIYIYVCIYMYIYNQENNMPCQLSQQWLFGNSCILAHDVSWIIYDHLQSILFCYSLSSYKLWSIYLVMKYVNCLQITCFTAPVYYLKVMCSLIYLEFYTRCSVLYQSKLFFTTQLHSLGKKFLRIPLYIYRIKSPYL